MTAIIITILLLVTNGNINIFRINIRWTSLIKLFLLGKRFLTHPIKNWIFIGTNTQYKELLRKEGEQLDKLVKEQNDLLNNIK